MLTNDTAENSAFTVPLLLERGFSEINTSDYVKSNDGDTFASIFAKYYAELKEIGLTEMKLADMTGLQSSTISMFLNGRRLPSLYSLTSLCIAMRLYYPRSLLLMKKARLALDDDSLKDRICRKYLIGCGFDASLDVRACNRELRENDQNELNT